MSLQPLPTPPAGVRYALTVPQSVLFADISLRGSRRAAFQDVFGADFELDYVVIDDGAMSWDFTGDTMFAEALLGAADAVPGVRRFIAAMGATARAVERTSWLLSSPTNRREGSVPDLLEDLREYWDAYERHMTSLFTFWNVEDLLSEALTARLRDAGRHADIQSGLQRFLQPSETNYFSLERRHLARIASRFGTRSQVPESALTAAVEHHVQDFGFLLAPFNLGTPPSVASVLERLTDATATAGQEDGPLLDMRADALTDVPASVRELGLLAQELTFWKTERLDVMSLGDARAANLYRTAAESLTITTDHLFAMQRDEIDESLIRGEPVVSEEIRSARLAGYCLALYKGEIGFYEPSRKPAPGQTDTKVEVGDAKELRGIAASAGVVSGPVRIIIDLSDIGGLEPGDVLVTTMTRPEMGVALDRASAFVTDQGGRMSHAAIIAREMKKPCVIGTERATAVLKDGMTVTVDGDAGTVTIESAMKEMAV